MSAAFRKKVLIILTVFVWLAVIFASVGKFKLAAKPPLKIYLKTTPAIIKLAVDGERKFRGRYAKTPVFISVTPGKHRLKVKRRGYVSQIMEVTGMSGDSFKMDSVVLERNDDLTFTPVHVVTDPEMPAMRVSIDDGFYMGEVPVIINDLEADVRHTLTAYPHWPDKSVKFRCRFNPEFREYDTPYTIILGLRNKRLTAKGCRKLRASPKK